MLWNGTTSSSPTTLPESTRLSYRATTHTYTCTTHNYKRVVIGYEFIVRTAHKMQQQQTQETRKKGKLKDIFSSDFMGTVSLYFAPLSL